MSKLKIVPVAETPTLAALALMYVVGACPIFFLSINQPILIIAPFHPNKPPYPSFPLHPPSPPLHQRSQQEKFMISICSIIKSPVLSTSLFFSSFFLKKIKKFPLSCVTCLCLRQECRVSADCGVWNGVFRAASVLEK